MISPPSPSPSISPSVGVMKHITPKRIRRTRIRRSILFRAFEPFFPLLFFFFAMIYSFSSISYSLIQDEDPRHKRGLFLLTQGRDCLLDFRKSLCRHFRHKPYILFICSLKDSVDGRHQDFLILYGSFGKESLKCMVHLQ